jgi:hypothetical protein
MYHDTECCILNVITLRVVLPSIAILSLILYRYSKRLYAKYRSAQNAYAEYPYADRNYADCLLVECHGAEWFNVSCLYP